MKTLKTAAEIVEIVNQIEAELDRLGWLADAEQPCGFDVNAVSDLPNGWFSLTSDSGNVVGESSEILEALKEAESGELGSCFATAGFSDKRPDNSRDWPEDLIEVLQIGEGTINDNPMHLIMVGTNGGVKFAAGYHGVSQCALEDWLSWFRPLADSQTEALTTAGR
jgi:hypothetical protein